ncbi:MAG: patatin-like phospholipase family protein [Usitatibacter sp.]
MRFAAVLIVAAANLCGCATAIFNKASNEPWTPGTSPDMGAPADVMRENSIIVMFSGGGLRAAAFAHGVLTALESEKTPEGDLLDDVAIMSSVSGSSLTAAYYGLYGRDGLRRFREEVLLPGFESGLRLSLNPANLLRILHGGLNAREDFGDVLDHRVFHGATFADFYRHPRPSIRIHATDLYYRVPFPFIPPLFAVLCSDLSRYSVADAVAATMAVPIVFAPIVVRTYPDSCPPLPKEVEAFTNKAQTSNDLRAISRALGAYRDRQVHYIKLADGGLTDNYGVSLLTNARIIYGTPYAPMTAPDAVRIRRLLVIVVDASRGPSGDWINQEEGPVGLDLALSAADAAVDSAARLAADAFDAMIDGWRDSVIAFRCGLSREEVARLGGPAEWNCRDVRFTLAHLSMQGLPSALRERLEAIPTRLSLTAEQIDTTIEGARVGMRDLPQLRAYIRERVH